MYKTQKAVSSSFLIIVAGFLCAMWGQTMTSPVSQKSIDAALSLHHDMMASFAVSKPTLLPLSREERTVYADFGQANLTSESKQRLDALALLLASEKNITGMRIIGYADRVGNASFNQHLAQERVENVQRYLVSKGLVKARTADTRWLGTQVPTTECSDNLDHESLINCLRQDRRVEIEVDYKPNFEASRY